ncbi:hypothetical protein EDB85DRAFT_2151116 [Lactarius pseudohatsudake]|nr:hypothetical protein EDB85DRAFT_2151116 [Lactarius pseudohatsudake]
MAFLTLRPIRNVYTALHQDTGSAPTRFSASSDDSDRILFNLSSYPVCNVVGHIHGTVLCDSAALPTTLPELSSSFPESHRAIIATTPSTSLGPSSALGIAAEDDGGRGDKDVGPPSVNRTTHANATTTLDLPPQSLSLPSDADSAIAAIAGSSQRAERIGDHALRPSHCRYDIV